jgi:hypothetical protein
VVIDSTSGERDASSLPENARLVVARQSQRIEQCRKATVGLLSWGRNVGHWKIPVVTNFEAVSLQNSLQF